MESHAKLSSVRITPRKVGLICDQIRGKGINEALSYLQFSPRKRTAGMLAKLLKSAVANATQKGQTDVDQLIIKSLLVGQGTTLKRFNPRAKGAADRLNKNTSHIRIVVAEKPAKKSKR